MTTIQWTDETWNPTTGCSRVSKGCRHCYIERTPPFRMAGRKLGDPVQLHHDRLEAPLHWKKPRRVFVNSLSDLFHDDVPDEFVDQVLAIISLCPHHTFQVLTKRIERMMAYFSRCWWFRVIDAQRRLNPKYVLGQGGMLQTVGGALPNVWLGVSVEDQKTADERVPILLHIPAAVRFLSVEPLLGPVYLHPWLYERGLVPREEKRPKLDWAIVGGESGPKSRPCDVVWIRSIVRQCKAASVPCFVKQLGDYVLDRNDAGFDGEMPTDWPMDTDVDDPVNEWNWQGAKIRVRLSKKGGIPKEWPEDLRVREWPK